MRVKGDGLNQEQIEVAVIVHAKCIIIHSGETDLELIYQTINTEGSQMLTHRVFLAAPVSIPHRRTGGGRADESLCYYGTDLETEPSK